jgi:AbiV family abortive infection protein
MKKKRVVEQYRNHLSLKQVADGMNAAMRNASRLLDDARMLADAKRFPTACSLAILSIEESGKLSVLRSIATAQNDRHLKDFWRDYRNHQTKNAAWIICDLAGKGAKTLDDLRPIFDLDGDHTAVLDVVKQIGFYTDCFGNAHWSEPHVVVDEALAKYLIFIAQVLVPKAETTEREMELWVDHIGKDIGNPTGLLEFHKAMIAEGLTNHSLEEVERFLR